MLCLAILLLVLSSCSSSYDGWFANPCAAPLVVRTFYAEHVNGVVQSSDDVIAEATLAPEAVTKVPNAFQDAAGFTWFLTIGHSEPIKLTKADMPHWVVALPASACAAP
ncbi:MAG TPA: hypothetical protein VFE86_11230 [Ilumatobacteraceae bacterium]|nr:hypothetical protein [Ilumatobacteraceae bacterium]